MASPLPTSYNNPPHTFSNATPFSAAAKAFPNPDFCLEKRRTKVVSLPVLSFQHQQSHPDEEKGRSYRSGGSRTSSSGSLGFGDLSLDSNGSSTDVELDDGAFADAWLDDRKTADPFSAPSVLGDIFQTERAQDIQLEARSSPAPAGGVDWTGVLAEAIETARETIDLSGRGLNEVPDSIWELSTMRKIPDPRLPLSAVPSLTKSLGRTQSGPLPFGSAAPRTTRTLSRSLSSSLGYSSSAAVQTSVPIQLNLCNNNLCASSISHALFTIPNLKMLFLRRNQLDRLPESIGRLTGLVELSLSGNQLQYLPAEILRLSDLTSLRLHPNPFLKPPPSPSDTSATTSHRLLGPLITHFRVPSLVETCTRYLLSSATNSTSFSPNILNFELPSFLPDTLRLPFQTTLSPPSATSGSSISLATASRSPRRPRERTTSANSFLSSSSSSDLSCATAVDRDEDEAFDPLANICRSPTHPDEERPFYRHAVERIEWVAESCFTGGRSESSAKIPIRHRGCGATCLDWLEEPLAEEGAEQERGLILSPAVVVAV